MTKLIDKKSIPVVKSAVVQYVELEEAAGKKAADELWSILNGPRTRLDKGKKAAGPALAAMHGQLPVYRLTTELLKTWFLLRCPLEPVLATATRKKGMSAMRGFLTFCIAQRWCEPEILNACVSIGDSPPRSTWLQPEQLVALKPIIENPLFFDEYQRFVIELPVRDLGLRVQEATGLTRDSLDRRARVVNVVGKGSGAGKLRAVPVDDDGIARWDSHVERWAIAPGGWMTFSRSYRFIGGSRTEAEWVPNRNRRASAKSVQNLVTTLSQLAEKNLPPDLAPTFKLTPHDFRRTYACTQVILHALGLGGMDLVRLQEAMGHKRLDTTRVYLSNVADYLNARLDRVNTGSGAEMIVGLLAAGSE